MPSVGFDVVPRGEVAQVVRCGSGLEVKTQVKLSLAVMLQKFLAREGPLVSNAAEPKQSSRFSARLFGSSVVGVMGNVQGTCDEGVVLSIQARGRVVPVCDTTLE